MEENAIIKYGIIFIVIVFIITVVFHAGLFSNKKSSQQNLTISSIKQKINATSLPETFNLSKNENKILTGTLTYRLALNSSYIPGHYDMEFNKYYSSLPIIFSNVNPYTHQSYINLTSSKRIFINESDAEVIINLNGNYAFITVYGSYNKIYILNGLYTAQIPTTSQTIKNNTVITKDSYSID